MIIFADREQTIKQTVQTLRPPYPQVSSRETRANSNVNLIILEYRTIHYNTLHIDTLHRNKMDYLMILRLLARSNRRFIDY